MKATGRLSTAALTALEDRLDGEIIAPDHPGYDEARRIWNASIDRRPALIVRPGTVDDVAAAIRFGREHDLPIAVRGGSHSVAGHSTCDDGLVIDLVMMKAIEVDPQARRARVGGGTVWGEVDAATQAHGLAVTGGLISSTGVGGFTLGGGIGWLQRKLGLACDNLVAADVVTADGTTLRASADDDRELLWGLRGGGGNFGVVTSFEFDVHPVGPTVDAGMIVWPGERAAEVLTAYAALQPHAPDELMLVAVLRLAPPAPFLPEDAHGKPMIAVAGMHIGGEEAASRDLAPLRDLGGTLADIFQPRPYAEMQKLLDGSWTPGFQNYWKAEYLTGLPSGAIDTLVEALGTITSPLSDFKVPYLGGAMSRVGEDDTAYGHRGAPFIVNINTRWESGGDDDGHVAWTRALWDALQPHSSGGTYTNFTSEDDAHRVKDSYGEAKYARLQTLKRRFDPDNVFRLNQNIQP